MMPTRFSKRYRTLAINITLRTGVINGDVQIRLFTHILSELILCMLFLEGDRDGIPSPA
jgi:hypothetical protein